MYALGWPQFCSQANGRSLTPRSNTPHFDIPATSALRLPISVTLRQSTEYGLHRHPADGRDPLFQFGLYTDASGLKSCVDMLSQGHGELSFNWLLHGEYPP